MKGKKKTKNNYDEKYFRIKFSSDDELPLNKTIEIPTITIAFRAALHENKKIIHKFSKRKNYMKIFQFRDFIQNINLPINFNCQLAVQKLMG